MKGIDSVIRLQKWQVDEQRRQVADLEGLLMDLTQRAQALEQEILKEQEVAADQNVAFIYGNYVRHAISRRETLQRSIVDAEVAAVAARDVLTELYQDMKRYEIAKDRHDARQALKENRAEQAELDDIALKMHRRKKTG
ncbi:MAG: flagellar FliJ family protein [Proteobacteria bacterium]|nr:flagellar FliJ family protein [Pseudomonadota bacterium]